MAKITIENLAGMDERQSAPLNCARSIKGMRYDADRSLWVSDRGYRSYWLTNVGRGSTSGGDNLTSYSLWYFETRGGGTKDLLIEKDDGSGGVGLYRVLPHDSQGAAPFITGRTQPSTPEPASSWATYGNLVVTANGRDTPLRIYPKTNSALRAEPFGFPQRPTAPIPLQPEAGQASAGANDPYYASTLLVSDVTVAIPSRNVHGMGDPTSLNTNSFKYVYTWVTDTGSESPLSAASTLVSWANGSSTFSYRYGIVLTGVSTGPRGTIKRRIYRTRNLGLATNVSDSTYYFVGEIPNNYETAFTDLVPDSLLAGESIGDIDSYPLPPNIRWVTTHAGRLWLVSNDYRVHWSKAGAPEQFGVDDYVEVSGGQGGRITGLISNNDILLVLRERGIDAILATPNGLTPFRSTSIHTNLGTYAPHAAIAVPGYGVLIVANEGIYAIVGSYTGGGQVIAFDLTTKLEQTWSTINRSALSKACAWMNQLDNEVVFALPRNSNTYNDLHLALALNQGNVQEPVWSIREGVQASFGISGPEAIPYLASHNQGITGVKAPFMFGVWAGYNQYGHEPSTYAPYPRPESEWESVELTFGEPGVAKTIRSITASIQATGNVTLYCDVYRDEEFTPYQTQQGLMVVQHLPTPSVYDTVTISEDNWDFTKLAEVRFDFAPFQAYRFRFRVRSEDVCAFRGFTIDYDVVDEQVLTSAIRNQSSGLPISDARKP